jgi:ABC-type multidrug transport system ATPase subunit
MEEQKKPETFYVVWKEINYSIEIKNKTGSINKQILSNVTGYAESKQLTAIMGPSGSGKTSLLNFLTNRIEFPKNSTHEGKIFVNSEETNFSFMEEISSYVMQDDLLFDILTPKETFMFVARLRKTATYSEHEENVQRLIEELKLKNCENIRIGNALVKGISCGERKRVSIGVEIMSNPSILFLDEPTSGLDSKTSFVVIDFLREFAEARNIPIIFTIHLPSSNIMSLINRVIMLNKGRLTYQGPTMRSTEKVFDYLKELSPPMGKMANPADYFMHALEERNAHYDRNPEESKEDLIAVNYQKKREDPTLAEIKNIFDAGRKSDLKTKQHESVGFYKQFSILSYRAWLNLIRTPATLSTKIFAAFFFTFLIISTFYNMGNDLTGTNNRMGFLFIYMVNTFENIIFTAVLAFPSERGILLREYKSKLYGIIPYYLSKNVIETPLGLIMTFIQTAIIYYLVNLRGGATSFFVFQCIFVALSWFSQSLGLCYGASFSDISTALLITEFSLNPSFLFSGYLINQENMPVWLGWLRFISPFRYCLEATFRNQFEDNPENSFNPVQALNYDIGLWNCVLILFLFGLGLRILGCIFLKLVSSKRTG